MPDFLGLEFPAQGPAAELAIASAIVIASFLLAKFSFWLLRRYVMRIARRTRSTLDDRILVALEAPLFMLTVSVGLFLGLGRVSFLREYAPAFNQLFGAVWILLGGGTLIRLGDSLLSWYAEEVAPRSKAMVGEILPTLRRIFRAFVIVIALMMLLGNFGFEITPLVASLGIAGLAVALAFQDTLGNFFAGIYITADRPVRVGDYIRLDTGDEGYIAKIGWRSTQVRTLPNNIVVIPNAKLAQSVITNYHAPDKQMAVLVQGSVGYGSDLGKAERIAVESAKAIQKRVPGAVRDFEPFIRYNSFGDSGIGFTAIMRAEEFVDQFLIKHEFIKELHRRFGRAGIEIPYPKRDVYLRKAR